MDTELFGALAVLPPHVAARLWSRRAEPGYRAATLSLARRSFGWGGGHAEAYAPPAGMRGPDPSVPTLDEWTYVTTARLIDDTHALLAKLPPAVDLVVAVARSGLLPGSLIATRLHLPLRTISKARGLAHPGHGGRMTDHDGGDDIAPRHVLLIDDTAATGAEMRANAAAVRAAWPNAELTRAVVYCHPQAAGLVDACAAYYPGMHWLEYNFDNAGHGQHCAMDFDGILCPDFTAEQCRDMESYRAAMAAMPPRHLPRRVPVHTVVTGRHESTRDVTEAWLARWGIRVDHLVMWPHDPHPPAADVAPWKAWHYTNSGLPLFVESDPWQAGEINRLTGKAVLCPAAGRVFPPAPAKVATPAVPPNRVAEQMAAVHECDYRGPVTTRRDGCQKEVRRCGLGRGPDPRDPFAACLNDCLKCLKADA